VNSTPLQRHLICALSDLPDPGTREFTVGVGEWPVPGFVVRYRGEVRAYLNRCPHAGHLLNWKTDNFFAPEGSLLTCTSHDAMFDVDTGVCVAGPCVGRSLRALQIDIVDGQILLHDPPPDVIRPQWGR
jgi:nitrite reductase/ring-hydroxylating ferredoxin subunit